MRIQSVTDEDRTDATELDHRGDYAERREATELARVDGITNAYNRTDIDGQSDYFNVGYYGRAEIETARGRQFREAEAPPESGTKLTNKAISREARPSC